MRDLYDRLILEGEAGILALITQRAQEGLQLDFKLKGHASHGAFEDTDKKNLAKAVSGFANSAGGLIIWGVNAEKVDGIDCAQSPAAPIANIAQFASETATLIGQLIQPKHDGVHIAIIPSSSGVGLGFLAVYVERSERRPHRSEARGQKQYFKRAGDSFFEMEHYDIEDQFRVVRAPELSAYVVHRSTGDEGDECRCRVTVGLHNLGVSIAKHPYIVLSDIDGLSIDPSSGSGFKKCRENNFYSFVGGADDVVHPDLRIPIADLVLTFVKSTSGHWKAPGSRSDMFVPKFRCTFGCEGARAVTSQFFISPDQFGLHP